MLNWFSRTKEDENQRRDVRFSSNSPVSCGNANALVKDVSVGGMRLSLTYQPEVGAQLSVRNSSEEVNCEIVWVRPTVKGYEAGLRYCDDTEQEARWIHQMLFSLN